VLSGLFRHWFARFWLGVLLMFVIIAFFGPVLAPFAPNDVITEPDGQIPSLASPTRRHVLGTTNLGQDVFSQLLVGTRPALAIGCASAISSTALGAAVGLVSGYFGGWSDSMLMRLTDLAYAVPFLAFALAVLVFVGSSIFTIIVVITLITWRTTARVIRSQVLVIREKPFIRAAELAGISRWRILLAHVAPNVLPMCYAYVALTASWAILTEASISFLGLGDPAMVTWGKMLELAYVTDSIDRAWWWVVPPGLAITLLSLSMLFLARELEHLSNPWLRQT
jgi:peptide/nickel transport system permease protein